MYGRCATQLHCAFPVPTPPPIPPERPLTRRGRVALTLGAGVVHQQHLSQQVARRPVDEAGGRPQQRRQVLVVERHDHAHRRQLADVLAGGAPAAAPGQRSELVTGAWDGVARLGSGHRTRTSSEARRGQLSSILRSQQSRCQEVVYQRDLI